MLLLLASCYATDRGISPPAKQPNYPTGLAVSPGGTALYMANSNFEMQFDAATLESYDLQRIRSDALLIRNDPRALVSRCEGDVASDACPYVSLPREDSPRCADAPGDTRTTPPAPDGAVGNICTPPMKPASYHRYTVQIGTFATDLQLSRSGFTRGGAPMRRLFAPIRGNASVTWIDVADDARDPNADAAALDCGAQNEGPCDILHQAGNRADEAGNSRRVTLPGEPFGFAQSPDGQFIALAHKSSEQASLLSTGLPKVGEQDNEAAPASLQFVTDGVPAGGNGVGAIPYDPDAFDPSTSPTPRPAFLLTSTLAPELTLLRVYDDQGLTPEQGRSTLTRPYLVPESRIQLSATPDGFDSRDVVVDDSKRRACKARIGAGASAEALRACARLPVQVFIANRSPASILVAELGERTDLTTGEYAPDSLTFVETIPVPNGVSRLQLAPIVDFDGRLAMRLFAVCFDSSAMVILDPDTRRVERILRVGRGPQALAFDPFDADAVARHDVPATLADGSLAYRFAYLASFTESYVQVIDLDRSDPATTTFEKAVFTLGNPTPPKSEQDQ